MNLKDVATVRSGFTARGGVDGAPEGVLAIQQGDFTSEGFVGVEYLLRTGEQVSRHVLVPGDVLFRSRGHYTTAWVLPEEIAEPAIAVMPLFVIKPNLTVVDPHYLAWTLNQRATQQYFRKSSQGQTIQMISKTVLEEVPLIRPGIARQREIAKVANLAARQKHLEARLLDCKYNHLTLQLQNAAHDFPTATR